ncbi:MAG: hypothetical protein EMLJLAPB_00026 [Candidatus Argoarchaeum ethanivorans]|uniref:Uncharacterized protein n=1 Tax=Candidatus Argoarchaeum ethanivorans TaxID=2608793 RepID=A0A811T385_9EURY|nr:MAG: hypothetical protein EMLJLAPB_00026 [Candidatus Argoarchaeum ethanivorans]
MPYSDMVKAIIIFVAGIIASVFARILYDLWNRPKVRFIDDIDSAGRCYSIFVENKGRSAAINCEAMLTLLNINLDDIIDVEGATVTTNSPRKIKDMNLSWARKDNEGCLIAITIYPGACQLLNFYEIEKPDLQIKIASEKGLDSPRVVLKSHKEYKGEIKIFAENLKHNHKEHKKKFIISKATDDDVKLKFIDNENALKRLWKESVKKVQKVYRKKR